MNKKRGDAMNKSIFAKIISFTLAALICFSGLMNFSPDGSVTFGLNASAATPEVTQNQRNMVARADYYYGITWVAQETVAGWGGTFYKGYTYHIPYGQPIYSGEYVGYSATFEEFIAAAGTAGSIFYTQRSWCDGTTAPYYASDCSSFVSWVWGINRTTTYYIPNVSTSFGAVTTYRATHTLQLGDALNCSAHVVMVTGLDYDSNGNITQIEITEQTPPQMKRSYHTPSSLAQKYGSYTIYRYYGNVPVAPNHDEEKPVISNITYSNVSAAGYTISCKVTDNVGVYRVAFPTWTLNNGQDDLIADFMVTQQGTKNGNIYTFEVKASAHNNETGAYATHIYAEDHAGNVTSLALPHVEVRNDTQNPVISDVVYSDVSTAGYTISCKVTDDWGVYSVSFPTWTVANGQDDLADQFMTTQLGTKNGDIYTFRVNASDHNNETGEYVTHIYAKDCAGNVVSLPLSTVLVMNDTENPVISDVVVSNVTAEGYTVSCKVTDNWGIQSVAFPTWTVVNGQDDLAEQFMNTQVGIKNGNVYIFHVKVSDHNNEEGGYVTHIYAKDCAGNITQYILDTIDVKDPGITLKTSSQYTMIQKYVYQVKVGTSVSTLLAEFENTGLEVVDCNGNVISDNALVGTGARVNLYQDDTVADTVTVIIIGDSDGNGIIDATDYLRIKAVVLRQIELTEAQRIAADVDENGIIDEVDYQNMKAYLLGTYNIG
jgi:hypothetical protein